MYFAGKSMVESKNLKLKLGFCGLALTSFLAINAHSTVHADTVDSGNASAITWDSDQDDSQVVKQDSQQQMPAQSEHVQAPAVQSVLVQNKVEQPVQKQATVQSNVQNRQSQPKTAISNVSSSSAVQNRAETSVVRVSNFDTSTVNRLNVDKQRAQAKVSNVNATVSNQPVQIVNPQNNQVVVHYVNINGETVAGVRDTTIDVTELGKGQYTVPEGYQLVNDGGYTTDDHMSTSQVQGYYYGTDAHDKSHHKKHKKLIKIGNPLTGSVAYKLARHFQATDSGDAGDMVFHNHSSLPKLPSVISLEISLDSDEYSRNRKWRVDISSLPIIYTFYAHRVNNDDGNNPITAKDIYRSYRSIPDSSVPDDQVLTRQECADFLNWANAAFGSSMATSADGRSYIGDPAYANRSEELDYELKMYSHKLAYRFTDNSGQVKSVTGNHINLAVTKPQSVDPNSANCKRQAQRVIHIAFPNGVKPESYDSITDSKGNKLTFDSNDNLTQTVTFTRSMTVDSLTGATLNQTPWQQHGAINAVTLPAIPGYTMVTNN